MLPNRTTGRHWASQVKRLWRRRCSASCGCAIIDQMTIPPAPAAPTALHAPPIPPEIPLSDDRVQPQLPGGSMRLFVAMMAAIMALNALAIDSMLPALPRMAADLRVVNANDQQLVVTLYFIGIGIGSLIHGPLADRYGRRPVVLAALAGYIAAALISGLSTSWTMLLVMRLLHGLFGAAMGVVTQAIVRDRTSGDQMARLMSLIFLVFMVVPVIAPTIGQAVLEFASWRWIFLLLAAMALVIGAWVWRALPETLDPADVTPINVPALARSWRIIAGHRTAFAYMVGSALAFGANFGFLNSSQQIFAQTFGRADIFPYAFAAVAATLALASLSNSMLVLRFGARRVSQIALLTFIAVSGLQWLAAGPGENMLLFLVLLAINFSMLGFIGSNFGSIAMQPFGHVAGAASSFQNSFRTLLSASVGAVIGAAFDGTTGPLAMGFVVCGIAALAFVLWGENGRLFTRPNPPARPVPPAAR